TGRSSPRCTKTRCGTGCWRPATKLGGRRTGRPKPAPSSSARWRATARSCGAPASGWKP
ncbi:MAG: Nicotinate-nucleotide--dimethylbenzimidazole phosphoribosyltransferase, partial [uncultured Acetobacteraceae bacterium]